MQENVGQCLTGKLMTKEELGRESLLHIEFFDQIVLVLKSTPCTLPKEGSCMYYSFNLDYGHFFARH